MSMTLTSLKARIDSELSMIGAFSDTVKTSIIADSLRQFIRKYEPTDISGDIDDTDVYQDSDLGETQLQDTI